MPSPARRLAATTLVAVLLSTAVVGAGLLSTPLVAAGPASAENRGRLDRAFQRLATFPVYRNSADPTTETVAEITAASTTGAP